MTKHAKINPEPGPDDDIRLVAVPPVLWPHLVRWLGEERGLVIERPRDSDVWMINRHGQNQEWRPGGDSR